MFELMSNRNKNKPACLNLAWRRVSVDSHHCAWILPKKRACIIYNQTTTDNHNYEYYELLIVIASSSKDCHHYLLLLYNILYLNMDMYYN